ncbi:MAG: hypothetical protein VX199_07320 [Chloroflexota bacterium]|nr:hypothetical protein [Chloroflexota bacterium]
MFEFLIFVLVVGFCIYWLLRHPIKTFKFVGAAVGLLILGVIGVSILGALILWFFNAI